VKLHNCGCSYCVATGCSQDRKEAQQQQRKFVCIVDMLNDMNVYDFLVVSNVSVPFHTTKVIL